MERELILSKNGKTLYREGQKVVKVFDHSIPKSEPFNEALINARIEELGDLKVTSIQEVNLTDEGWTITRNYIDGTTFDILMEQHPDKINYYLDLMLHLQMEIHSRNCPLLSTLRDKLSRQILEVDAEILSDMKRYDLLTRLDQMPKHRKLCHGEFCPENIILADSGELYTLDWVHATQGNASADIARTFLLFYLENPDLADIYLDKYCAATHTAKGYVRSWIPLMAAAQLSKKRPGEQESLLYWVDLLD